MTTTLVDIHHYRGRFFEVLQETERTQTAVMTIAPGQDGGPEETHAGDQVVFVVEGEAIVTVEGRFRSGSSPTRTGSGSSTWTSPASSSAAGPR